MSETLWAAVIGGTIGIAATIPALIVNHCRWKKDKKLEHLKAERRHLEEQYLNVLKNLDILMKGNSHSTNIRTRIGLTLPHEVAIEIYNILDNKEWDEDVNREVVIPYGIETAMRKSLDEIDKKIEEIMPDRDVQ